MDVGAAPAEAPVTVEDRLAAVGKGEAQQLRLRGPLPAAAALPDGLVPALRQDSSASPVGSADSGAGSRSASGTVSPAASAS